MLSKIVIVVLAASLWTLPNRSADGESLSAAAREDTDARAAFKRLSGLVGTWMYTVDGRPGSTVATYRMTGRNVLVEDMGGMMTAYHLDGDKLVMTHYCGAGNQPRMRMTRADDRRVAFAMYDITNLSSPDAYHSTHLEVVFIGKERVNLAYSGTSGGDKSTQVFELKRRIR